MKELSVKQMEIIQGGRTEAEGTRGISAGCWWAIAGMAVTITGAFFLTGIGGLILYQAALAAGAGGMITSCG